MANDPFDLDVRVTDKGAGAAEPASITPTITISIRLCTRVTCRSCTCVSCISQCPISCLSEDA